MEHPHGISRSFYSHRGFHCPRDIWRTVRRVPSIKVVDNGEQIFASATINQTAEYLFQSGTLLDIASWLSSLKAYQGESVSTLGAQQRIQFRGIVKRMTKEYLITNLGNTTCRLFVYDLYAKHDLTPIVDNTAVTLSQNNPYYTVKNGVANAQNLLVSSAAANIHFYGVSPHLSSEFTQMFGIGRIKCIMLEPGESHVHHVNVTYDRYYDFTRYNEASSVAAPAPLQSPKEFYNGLWLWAHGMVGVDNTGHACMQAVKLGVVWRREVSLLDVPTVPMGPLAVTNNLSIANTISATGIINPDTAAVQGFTPAT